MKLIPEALNDQSRNFGLDIVRALSISLVIYSHLGDYYSTVSGIIGVEFFFVLSGFLIGQILYKNFESKGRQIAFSDLTGFWKRRWWRTLPLYYLVILFHFSYTGFEIGKNIFYYLFFLQNHFYGVQFYSVTWSLVIEEWFYLLIPMLLFLLYRCNLFGIKIIWTLLAFSLLLISFKLFFIVSHDTTFSGIRPNVLFRLDSLCMGVILAFLKMNRSWLYEKLKNVWFFILGIAAAALLVVSISDLKPVPPEVNIPVWLRALWFSFFSFSVCLMVPFLESSETVNKRLRSIGFLRVIFTLISVLTYSIYLTHPYSLSIIASFDLGNLLTPAKIILILTIAWGVFILYEHPMTGLRERKFRFFGN